MRVPVAIVGGGLSGVYAAHLLRQQGIDCVLLEARDRLGGRIRSVPVSGAGSGSMPVSGAGAVLSGSVPLSVPLSGSVLGTEVAAGVAGPVATSGTSPAEARFDLGPAWFWPDFQLRIAQLVSELGLQAFAQHTQGDVLVERSLQMPPQRQRHGFTTEPPSMRLAGGMQTLLEALARHVPAESIRLNTRVRAIRLAPDGRMELETVRAAGAEEGDGQHDGDTTGQGGGEQSPSVQASERVTADHVILALPPRLAQDKIAFLPALALDIQHAWRSTPTWMAGHAKAMVIYERAFWREQGLSGMASSHVGPLVEIHDACDEGNPAARATGMAGVTGVSSVSGTTKPGSAALFGFLGVPARTRATLPSGALQTAVVAQLVRLFGPEAAHPIEVGLQDWATESYTATPLDAAPPNGHPSYGFPATQQCLWDGRLLLAGTEAALRNGGYLEGALEAAERAVQQVLRQHLGKV